MYDSIIQKRAAIHSRSDPSQMTHELTVSLLQLLLSVANWQPVETCVPV